MTLLAHSYGGIPATEAAGAAPNVARIVYLAAHLLEAGESLVTPLGGPGGGSRGVVAPAKRRCEYGPASRTAAGRRSSWRARYTERIVPPSTRKVAPLT